MKKKCANSAVNSGVQRSTLLPSASSTSLFLSSMVAAKTKPKAMYHRSNQYSATLGSSTVATTSTKMSLLSPFYSSCRWWLPFSSSSSSLSSMPTAKATASYSPPTPKPSPSLLSSLLSSRATKHHPQSRLSASPPSPPSPSFHFTHKLSTNLSICSIIIMNIVLAISVVDCEAPVSPLSLVSSSSSHVVDGDGYPFSRPTPFSPYYRPECDLIFPASMSNSVHSSSSTTTSSSSSYHQHHDSSYYGIPPPPSSSPHSSTHADLLTTNELSSDYDMPSYYNKPENSWFRSFPSSSPAAQYLSSYVPGISKRSSYIPGGHVCITYEDINRAISEAKMMLGVFAVPYEVKELSSDFPKVSHIGKVGEILLKASSILARMHSLSRESILYGLPRIDTYKTSIRDMCPAFLKPVKCEISKYRTLSGMCNNLEYPSWGSSRSAMLRFLPPDYADGLTMPRVAKNGQPLPPPRIVSFMFHQDVSEYDHEVTYLVIAWGQMLDHDLTFAAIPKDKNDQPIQCCKYPPQQRHASCYPISLPSDDPFYKFFNRQCMDFVRSAAGVKPNCPLGPRHQINSVSSFIDANFVYGNAQSTSKRLREFIGGRLKTSSMYRSFGYKDLLPMKTQNPDTGCERSGRNRNLYCFDAGDQRSNEQLQLVVMHTVWMREHNRIADQLSMLNPHWDDEKLFQETRRIVGAIVQHITYNEFLPIIIGRNSMTKYGINLLKYGHYNGYNPKVNPGIRVEFQASAFRFGHSILPDTTERYNKFHEKLESIRLSTMLRQPYALYRPGIVDTFIFGLINQPAYRVDSQITTEVTNHLFEKPGEHFGLDLAAINVARAREMGIPGYNDMREYCGLHRVKHFEDLYGLLPNTTIRRYMTMYHDVDDIDFWSAGIAEYPLMGAMVGPTFACIIGEQFAQIRNGDRFWYENEGWPSQFSTEQLSELRKVKLARLFCENADDMDTVQLYPMLSAHPTTNPRVNCHDLPAMDLSPWREMPYFDTGMDDYKAKSAAAGAAAKAAA